MTKAELMDILDRLKSEWSSEYALQPTNEASRKVVIEIQALKKEAANEIESLRAQLAERHAYSNNDNCKAITWDLDKAIRELIQTEKGE